jgi:hypothetical protein
VTQLYSLTISRVVHAVVEILPIPNTTIVSAPSREIVGLSTAAEDGEAEDEDDDLGSSVQGGGDEVVVFDEDVWLIFAKIELGEEADGKVTQD